MTPAIPIVVGGVLAVAAGLRIRAIALAKKSAAPSGVSGAKVVPTTTVAQAAAQAAGLPIPPAKPGDPTMADLAASLANPAANKVSFDSVTVEQLQAAQDLLNAQKQAGTAVPALAVTGKHAIVTTNDQPPEGDLIVRSSPSASAPQIGGADKGGAVTVLRDIDNTWAEITWSGGRWPAVQGFARKAFLAVV